MLRSDPTPTNPLSTTRTEMKMVERKASFDRELAVQVVDSEKVGDVVIASASRSVFSHSGRLFKIS